jgi:prolyl-tRNA editing enzyme YbaK/EbsC (Cys-tRNA(Pro) deacylase)
MEDRNIPYGCECVDYDADTEVYTYLDNSTGRCYTTSPGMRYGNLESAAEPKTKRKARTRIVKNETTSPIVGIISSAVHLFFKTLHKYEEKKKRRRLARQRALDETGYYV